MHEHDLKLSDGRTLHAYDTGGDDAEGRLAVFWHHGTPNLGEPPEPLFDVADRLGIRWVSYDRPGYGGSTPNPGRDIASAASDVAAVADALGIERFAVMGHSGGGPHAMACGVLLADRVTAVVSVSGLAPFDGENLDWFAGLAPSGEASLRAAAAGREAKERYEATPREQELPFTAEDFAALDGDWAWLGKVAVAASQAGPAALIDDDLAYVAPWGFDPARLATPLLLLHGERDRVVPSSHSAWLASHCPTAELRLSADDSHISILRYANAAAEWIHEHADG